jgi:N-acetyl sugar amidotransferase
MTYCKKCVYPNTKPDLKLNKDDICSACICYNKRDSIDWNERKKEFIKIMDENKSKDGTNYDCIIPCSGGKDSTYQVWRVLELGYNPLVVFITTCEFSELGRKNIENIKDKFDVDVIEVCTNRKIRYKLNKYCLETLGDIQWPEHIGIFTIPFHIAVKYKIKLLIWGECPQNEYGAIGQLGGSDNVLDRRWMEEFGGLNGFRISDAEIILDLPKNKILPFIYPEDEDIKKLGVKGIFLGYYFPWDEYSNYVVSLAKGFTCFENTCENSIVNYVGLDSYHVGIHDYFKYLKFGFSRASDHLAMYVRRGVIDRDVAVSLVKSNDGLYPKSYLGKDLNEILKRIGVTIDEFNIICNNFTNTELFEYDNDTQDFVRRHDGSPKLKTIIS